jgi:hypothetical protein
MTTIYEFLNAWRELIIKVFGEYPLAAALITILAIGMFYGLQTEWRRGRLKSNLLLVFVGWLIAVPIVGLAMTILSKVWEFIEGATPIVTNILGSFYHIYAHHPYLVLIILVLGIVGYFFWNHWWPRRPEYLQNRHVRILCVVACIVIVAHVASPIADLCGPKAPAASQPPGTDQKKAP